MPKTAITLDVPRSTTTADSDDKTKSNGGSEEKEDKEKKEGGGLYDLKTRKQIQTFLEVRKKKLTLFPCVFILSESFGCVSCLHVPICAPGIMPILACLKETNGERHKNPT